MKSPDVRTVLGIPDGPTADEWITWLSASGRRVTRVEPRQERQEQQSFSAIVIPAAVTISTSNNHPGAVRKANGTGQSRPNSAPFIHAGVRVAAAAAGGRR